MNKLPELLSPAGGMEHLKAAVENGADAVYMGGRLFSARQGAENFDEDGMRRAIEYAHVRGVSIYVAMNTLIADGEMQQAVDAAGEACMAGADALIVQDMGFASLFRKHIPDLPLHMSTQGTVASVEAIRALVPLGFSRVILARELSLADIRLIAGQSPVPVEVFAHGALCVGYSGQCLMSSLIGGRSGNRGRCAQPCRLPYSLGGAKGYLLSPKDLCSLALLPELVDAGVAALKIEGRMKSPEYVAVATRVYRKHLDQLAGSGAYCVDDQDYQELLQVFNRGGFTTGYLQGWQGRKLIARERPKHWGVPVGRVVHHNRAARLIDAQLTGTVEMGDGVEIENNAMPGGIVTVLSAGGVKAAQAGPGRALLGHIDGQAAPGDAIWKTSSKALGERAQASFTGRPRRKVACWGAFKGRVGEPLRFDIWDGDGNRAMAQSKLPAEQARTRPLAVEAVRAQLIKTGDSPFGLRDCAVELDGSAAASLSELNALRREALAGLEAARAHRYPGRNAFAGAIEPAGAQPEPVRARLSLFLYRWREDLQDVLHLADRVYIPLPEWVRGVVKPGRMPAQWMVWLPAVAGLSRPAELGSGGLDGILVGNAGHIELLRGCGLPLYGDSTLNAFNGWSLKAYAGLGLAGVALSQELTMAQIAALPDTGIEKEAAVYGRQPLMTSAHCPVGAELAGNEGGGQCGLCAGAHAYELIDRIGARFPVLCVAGGCRSTILNSDTLAVPALAPRLAGAGVSMLRVCIYDESADDVARILGLFRRALAGEPTDGPKGRGYTKGHYFRGV